MRPETSLDNALFFLTNHRHRKRDCGVWCASLSAVTLNSYCIFLWQNRTKSPVRAVHGAEGQMHKSGYLQIFSHLFFFLFIYSVVCFLTPISVSLKRILLNIQLNTHIHTPVLPSESSSSLKKVSKLWKVSCNNLLVLHLAPWEAAICVQVQSAYHDMFN